MNWEDVDTAELAENPQHHPKCKDKAASLEGLTPHVTAGGSRISWLTEAGHYGHHCFTSQGKRKASTKAERAKQLADAIGKVRMGDDEEARETLISMSNEELANVVLGSGAQKLQALKYLGELSNVGVATAKVDDPDQCPIGKGELDCPMCGGRHGSVDVYVSDELLGSLEHLKEIQGELDAR